MAELSGNIYQWLVNLGLMPPPSVQAERIPIDEGTAKLFFSGNRIGEIVSEIFKRRKEEVPQNLSTLKKNPQPAGQLYNWNLLNEVGFE